MRVWSYIREPRRLPLVWRAGLASAAVLVLVFILFVVTPITVHDPIRFTEALALAAGLGAMLVVNLLLLRRALSPLDELASEMDHIDLRNPRRVSAGETYGPALTKFVETMNAMLDRLAEERRIGARAALTAQERERLRIGRALHDEAGQTLTAIALEVERAASDGPEAQREQMASLAAQLHDCLDEIRRISRDLRPEALDDLGLVNALIALTSRVDRQSGVRIERRLSAQLPTLSTELELVIYRVAQEALTNVLRHAKATRCVVVLESSDDEVELRVSDDGVGMPSRLNGETIGIEGMRERALLGGGTLSIESSRGQGTQVTLRLPVPTVRLMPVPLKTRILLADDHELVRSGLKLVLDAEPDLAVVAEAGDGAEALEIGMSGEIDLAVLDVSMPRLTGLQVARELHRRRPELHMLMLSVHDNEQYFFEALKAGASGYVLKSAANRDLIEGCRATMRGEPFVYPRAASALVRDYLDRASRGEATPDRSADSSRAGSDQADRRGPFQ